MPAAAAAPAELPSPEQAVVLEPHRYWREDAAWDGNKPPAIFGLDNHLPQPRFSVVDPSARAFWECQLQLPIDLAAYPILKLKYRAANTNPASEYLLRLVQQPKQITYAVKGTELKTDGQVHEMVQDLRELGPVGRLMTIRVALQSSEKGNASFDLFGMTFSAAPDGGEREAFVPDEELKVRVTDASENPISGAKVIVDAERQNYSRTAQTDNQGEATLTPLVNERRSHVIRVEKAGFLSVDLPRGRRGGELQVQLEPASYFGGVAKDAGGKVLADAMVMVKIFNSEDESLEQHKHLLVTDAKGRWSTGPLPENPARMEISLTRRDAIGSVTTQELAAVGLKILQPLVREVAAPPVLAQPAPAQPAPAPPVIVAAAKLAANPITAIVQKVDDSTTGVGWTGVDGDQLMVVLHPQPGKDEPAKIPLMDVTEIVLKKGGGAATPAAPTTRPADTLPNARITLAGDDRLLGTVLGWTDKRLKFKPAVAPSSTFEIPVSSLRQIWCGTADQIKKAQALKEPPALEDVAFVTNEADVIAVRGIAIEMKDDKLIFRYDNEERKISLGRLVGLMMAKSEDAPDIDELYHSVSFVSDDQLSGKMMVMDGKELAMQTRAGVTLKVPVDQIAKISTRNGRLVFLSDMKPARVEQTPYFDRLLEFRIDKSLSGKPITMVDGTYPRGICVHSRCVLTYNLDGRFNEFRSKVGFQLPEGKIGQAAIRVLGDDKVLFENLEAKGDQPPADLKLKVEGVRELKLEVDYGKNDDVGDRVAWANARLLRPDKK